MLDVRSGRPSPRIAKCSPRSRSEPRASISASTPSSGGFETTMTDSVAGSAASARSAWRVERPPTCALRSRPPTPRQWLIPTPAASRRHITCWAPVPDAATIPTDPRRTTLAKPSATPLTTAVPQSGPMTSTSAAAAASLRAISSATLTLSEKSMTEAPASMASKASVTACDPGTDTRTSPAPARRTAAPRVSGSGALPSSPALADPRRRSASAASTAARPAARAASSVARRAMTRSLGPAPSGTVNPMPVSTSTLSSVAIATWAASTPGVRATARETCMRLTESW